MNWIHSSNILYQTQMYSHLMDGLDASLYYECNTQINILTNTLQTFFMTLVNDQIIVITIF